MKIVTYLEKKCIIMVWFFRHRSKDRKILARYANFQNPILTITQNRPGQMVQNVPPNQGISHIVV